MNVSNSLVRYRHKYKSWQNKGLRPRWNISAKCSATIFQKQILNSKFPTVVASRNGNRVVFHGPVHEHFISFSSHDLFALFHINAYVHIGTEAQIMYSHFTAPAHKSRWHAKQTRLLQIDCRARTSKLTTIRCFCPPRTPYQVSWITL